MCCPALQLIGGYGYVHPLFMLTVMQCHVLVQCKLKKILSRVEISVKSTRGRYFAIEGEMGAQEMPISHSSEQDILEYFPLKNEETAGFLTFGFTVSFGMGEKI